MANRLLRTIAIGVGAGLAVGAGRVLASRRRPAQSPYLTPLLARIDAIEQRVVRVETSRPGTAGETPEEIEALGTLVSTQAEDIAALRNQIAILGRNNAVQVENFSQKLATVEQQVPARVESHVAARMSELEIRLRGEFDGLHARTVEAFVEAIEQRVVDRIAALETNLIAQSQAIDSLREKSRQTDENLQKLLQSVERLCEKAEAAAFPLPPDPPAPGASGGSFAAQYEKALARGPVPHPEPEPELVGVDAGPASPVNSAPRKMKSLGLSILGLAIIGFRLIR